MLVTRKIAGPLEKLNLFFHGAVICGANLVSGQAYLHGLTLKTKSPNIKTVTFAAVPASVQTPISVADIIAQIVAVDAALAPRMVYDGNVHSLVIVEATPASGVEIDKTGTANARLGLSDAADTTGVFYNPPGGGTPQLVDLSPGQGTDNTYLVTTDE